MYFAETSMQGMEMGTGTHPDPTPTPKLSSATRLGDNMQHSALAVPVISILAIAIMLIAFWLLKRFTSWQFPSK